MAGFVHLQVSSMYQHREKFIHSFFRKWALPTTWTAPLLQMGSVKTLLYLVTFRISHVVVTSNLVPLGRVWLTSRIVSMYLSPFSAGAKYINKDKKNKRMLEFDAFCLY